MSTGDRVKLATEFEALLSEQQAAPAPEVVLRLTREEADLVVGLVSTGQYWQVTDLVQKLLAQMESQTREQDLQSQLAAMPADSLWRA